MGKALAIQTAKHGRYGLGGVAALGALGAVSGRVSVGKAKLHTSRPQEARAVEDTIFGREKGELLSMASLRDDPTTNVR